MKTLYYSLILSAALLLSACQTTKNYDEIMLHKLKTLYKSDTNNPSIAIKYATALRQNDYLNRAAIVIAPFANDRNSPSESKQEYAAIQLALGNYNRAEDYAQQAINQDQSAQAYLYLGLALEAKEMHQNAEKPLRQALKKWKGSPTTPMNHLALNLATQGQYEESIALLQKAASHSPKHIEIIRNLRMVQTLQEGSPKKTNEIDLTPQPKKKPQKN